MRRAASNNSGRSRRKARAALGTDGHCAGVVRSLSVGACIACLGHLRAWRLVRGRGGAPTGHRGVVGVLVRVGRDGPAVMRVVAGSHRVEVEPGGSGQAEAVSQGTASPLRVVARPQVARAWRTARFVVELVNDGNVALDASLRAQYP